MIKKILIYGMSNTISLLEFLTKEKTEINHQNYLNGKSKRIINHANTVVINGKEFDLYYMILNPSFIKETGGFGYYHEGHRKFIENESFNNEFQKELANLGDNILTLGCINGNEYNIMSLTLNRFPYDFRIQEIDILNTSKELVPLEIVKSELRNKSIGTIQLYKHLSTKLLNSKNYIIPPPPPINVDVRYVSIYNEGFREDANNYGINEINIRIKIYILYCSLLRELEEVGYKLFDIPESIYVPDGLAVDYASGVTHGNIKFAEELFKHIGDSLL
jgi:hypothetical protein